jgi:transcriptional regulator with XRE-family HTH domain
VDVDDAPQTDDLDLASVTTRDGLFAVLQTVYLRADRPSLRVLEARTRHGATPLSKTVAAELLKGARFPRKVVMLAFLQACGVQGNRLEPWQRAWERTAVLEAQAAQMARMPGQDAGSGLSGGSPPVSAARSSQASDEMKQLRAENQQLRRQLAQSGSGAEGRQSYRDDQSHGEDAGNPVVCRRELGASLHALRLERGLTLKQVAEHLLCSAEKVSRVESGFRSGTLRDVRDLCSLYDVPESQRDHLMELARESRRQGWWQAYPRVAFEAYIGLENGAASIREYNCAMVPGLLQTEGYARALHQAAVPPISPARIEEYIQLRLARQRILTRPDPLDFWSIIDEGGLRRLVGGPGVMRGQLGHLVEASRLPNVALQVIPFTAGAHSGPGEMFTILEFSGKSPGLVYTEGLMGWIYLERAEDLNRYQQVFDKLRAQALGEEESRALITTMMSEIGNSGSAEAR